MDRTIYGRRRLALIVSLCLVAGFLSASPALSAEQCMPGQNGCMPTRSQCATGEFNGYWSGGQAGRFTICLAHDGTIVTYVGGTATPPCGEIVAADQVVVDGDANSCGATGQTGGPLADLARSLGLDACESGSFTMAPEVGFTSCAGEMMSFDGVEIDARLTFPADAAGPLPLVTLLHGWGGDRRGMWQSPEEDPAGWGRARFIARGYATLATTARGFWASCGTADQISDMDDVDGYSIAVYGLSGGAVDTLQSASGGTETTEEDPTQCLDGYTHIAERDFEVRDTQHLLGRLVDAGIAEAGRLAVTGESYGGGQSWLLATSLPWDTPAAGERLIDIAASVPIGGWTDLADALIPNGRATDEGVADASREAPIGVLKMTWFDNLFRVGRARTPLVDTGTYISVEQGRYNTFKPQELHSFIDGWAIAFNGGEPYGSLAEDVVRALRGKSAMYADDYFEAIARGEIDPVPVFALQGWSDTLFSGIQSIQMYRHMKAIDPGFPVSIALGHFGHVNDPSATQLQAAYELAGRFIDEQLLGDGEQDEEEEHEPSVFSFETNCDGGIAEPVTGDSWGEMTQSALHLTSAAPGTTNSTSTDLAAGIATDPVLAGPQGAMNACLSQESPTEGAARWQWATAGAEEMLGLPRVTADYELTGSDATLIAKLWDVAPDGTSTLVTRGVYRLSTAAGNEQTGTLGFKLFGNHWTFEDDHTIALELMQTDAPFFRPDNLPSDLKISRVSLDLPRRGPSSD